jgi:hypothetical protein
VDVQQKVPLNIERDNVTPSYLKVIFGAILNEKGEDMSDEDAAAAWVTTGMESKNATPEAVKTVFSKRFSPDAVLQDHSDIGANKEATAAGRQVVPTGALTKEVRKVLIEAGVKKAGEEFSTHLNGPDNIIPDEKLTAAQRRYKQFIEQVAPLVLEHKLKKVVFANDSKANLYGCTRFFDVDYVFTVNIAHHDVEDWDRNYDLFIHELAHFYVQRNDHLFEGFWRAVSDIGARLARIALSHPSLFPNPRHLSVKDRVIQQEAA